MTAKTSTTEIVFVIDRSGSMCDLVSDTIGGFNSTLRKYKETDGRILVTTVLFDNKSETVHNRMPIGDVPEMTAEDYVPGGCTALLDTVGETVMRKHMEHGKEESPSKTVFVIITDGYENSSRTHTYASVKRMIEDSKKECGWDFVFLGANIDVAKEASRMGICADDAHSFEASERGMEICFETVCCSLDKKLDFD